MKKSKKATWSASIFVDCPHCGEQQDLLEDPAGDKRIDYSIHLAEHGTKKTTNFETWCIDCDEFFIVPDLEW